MLTTDAHMSTIAPLADGTGAKVFRISEPAQEDTHAAQACPDAVCSAWMGGYLLICQENMTVRPHAIRQGGSLVL